MTPSVLSLIGRRRPTSGVPAHLQTADGHKLAVSISTHGDDMLLVLLVNPGPLLRREDDELLLESITSRGVIRMHGTATKLDVDLYRFQPLGEPEVIQRREYVRIVAPQQVRLDDLAGVVVDTQSVNISGGGMLIAARDAIPEGTELKFTLGLERSEPPLIGLGRVVRCSEEHQLGIVFTEISDLDRDRLIRFIFDRQRRALALTRGDGV